MREESHRRETTQADGERAQLEARFAAEKQAAIARIAPVREEQWWETASRDDVAATWQLAHTWRDDPTAAETIEKMREQVKTRYGIDVETRADGPQVRELLNQADHDRAETERAKSARQHIEAQRIAAQADRADQATETGEPARDADQIQQDESTVYDSAERRHQRAEELERAGIDKETAAGVLRADVSQGRPATDAVRNATARKATRAPAFTGRAKSASKSELSR